MATNEYAGVLLRLGREPSRELQTPGNRVTFERLAEHLREKKQATFDELCRVALGHVSGTKSDAEQTPEQMAAGFVSYAIRNGWLESSASAKKRIGKVAIVERFGARLTNDRWGWDATRPDGTIVFIGWAYRATRDESGQVTSCEIYKYGSPHNDGPGGRERGRHIAELFETGSSGLLLLATPKDPNVHPHQIETVDEALYSVRLEREGDYVHARVIALNSAPDIPEHDLLADVDAVVSDPDLAATERAQLVQARRGQGLFRARVELLEAGCRLTGITDRAHLRASHIKPWRVATNAERLDGHNGLLLAPHVDHLFDRGFIAFAVDGTLLVSHRLDRHVLHAWGIVKERALGEFTNQQKQYLAFHRDNVFLG